MVSFKLKLTLILIAATLGTQANTATDSTDTTSSLPATCTCPVVTCPSSSLPDTTSSTPAPTRCPPGWILWETHCYYISKGRLDEINTFYEAQAMCVQRAGPNFTASVASIHSYEENQFIYNEFMSQQYRSEQVFIGLLQYEVLGNYFWLDETPVDYTQWGPLHPYERTSGYQCGQITLNDQEVGFNGEWKNYYCTPPTYYFSGYVCKTQPAQQFPATGTATPGMQPTSLSPNEGCPPAWIGWQSNCYYFSPEEKRDVEHYDHALEKCQAMASAWDANFTAYPASVLDHAENQFIYNELYRRNLLDNAILGLAQEKSGDRQPFYWADGSPVNYTNWIDNAPFFVDDDPACAEMYMKEGKWNDASRNDGGTFKNYVCKGKKKSTVY